MRRVTVCFIAVIMLLPVAVFCSSDASLVVCYNFGCKVKGTVLLAEDDVNLLRSLFINLDSAEAEREAIRQAVAWIEQLVGRQLPTSNDVGGNYQEGMKEVGQMDCIDESTNTTTYLTFLQQQGLLRWHLVEKRAFRSPYLFDQHWSAQIKERISGRHYVVDSWFDNNGEPPLIQSVEEWQLKRPVHN